MVVEATVVAVEDPVPRRLQQMHVQTDLSCSVVGCVVAFYVVNVLEKIQFGGAENSADMSIKVRMKNSVKNHVRRIPSRST